MYTCIFIYLLLIVNNKCFNELEETFSEKTQGRIITKVIET